MKTLILILIASLTLSGCITENKCNRRFPPIVNEIIKTEIKIETRYRDTIIYKELPPEIVTQTDTVIISSDGKINTRESYISTSLAFSTAQIINNRLHHALTQRDTTIEFRLQDAIKEIDRLETQLHEKTTTVEVPRKLTWWQRSIMGIGYLALILFGIFAAYKIGKARLKLPF